MAIQETSKKIHFIPYHPKKGKEKDESPAPTVTVSVKYGSITFSSAAIMEMSMRGKFIRFFFEPVKKVIGWQLSDSIKQDEMGPWRMVNVHPSKDSWQASIKKMVLSFDGRLHSEVYKKVPIHRYREANSLSEYKGQVFYFVELVDNPDELRKGLGNESLQEATAS